MRRKVERLVGSHYSSAVPGFAQNRFRTVVAVRIAPVEGPLVVQLPYILSQRHGSGDAPLVARTLDPLVRHFMAIFNPRQNKVA